MPASSFHAVIMGILVLESSGSNGSEVSAVLATQENRHDDARVVSGLEGQWPNHRLFQRDRDVKKKHAHHGDGWSCQRHGNIDELGDWEYSEDDQKDESGRGSGQNMTIGTLARGRTRGRSQRTQPSQLWICFPRFKTAAWMACRQCPSQTMEKRTQPCRP